MKKEKNKYSDDSYLDYFKPIEVEVTGRIEEAVHRFRALVTRERVMSCLKEHYAYEKPSEKKRRKHREAQARARKALAFQSGRKQSRSQSDSQFEENE